MASDTITKLLQSVYDKVKGLLEIDRFYVAMYDRRRGRLEFPLVVEGFEAEPGTWPRRAIQSFAASPDDGVEVLCPDWVIAQGKAVLCEQDLPSKFAAGSAKYWPSEGEHPLSWLGVPLLAEEQILGALVVENRRKAGAFEQKIGLLTTVARQAAIALANARLRDRLERQIANLNALYEMGQILTGSIRLGEAEIVAVIHQQASRMMDTQNMYIALYDDGTDEVQFALAYLAGEPVDTATAKGWGPRQGGKGRTEWIIHNQKPLLDKTKAESEAWYAEPGREEYIGQPFASWVGVPMMARNKVLGGIATYHASEEYVYDEDDVQVLTMLANQAAVALENARLFQGAEWARQLTALHEVGVKITSQLELDEVLGSVVDNANQILSADFSTLFPYDREQDRFEKGIRRGKVAVEPSIPSTTGFAAHIVKSQQAVFTEDAEQESGVKPTFIEQKRVKSFAGVPLVSKGKSVGILFVNYLETHSFSPQEKETVRLLANQAAAALENTRLHEQLLDEERKRIEAEKWGHLGRIAGSLAHRIGNKGGMIRLCVNELENRLESLGLADDQAKDDLETIQRSNQYLLNLSEFLFRPLQAASEKLEKTDIKLYLEDAIRSTNLPDDVILETEYDEDIPRIPASKYFVEVFMELVDNAVESMRSSQEKKLRISVKPVSEWIEIRFADTGRGIDVEDKDAVFELFARITDERLAEQRDHQGFGLWWVKTYLTGIGGSISYESEPGKGTTFFVRLPRGKSNG